MKKKIIVILLAMILAMILGCVSVWGNSGTDNPSVRPETELSDSIVTDDQTDKNESTEDNTEGVKDSTSEDTESTQNTENNENQSDDDRKDNNKDSDDTEISKDSSSDNKKNEADTNTGSTGNSGSNGNSASNNNSGNNGNSGNSGNTGNTGSSGTTGNTGNTGNAGNTGSTGNAGNSGNTGNTGSSSETTYVSSYTKEENQLADAVIAKVIRSSMGEFERVKAIHDYLLMNVDYDYQNYLNNTVPDVSHTAKGALVNKYAVCDGYSNAFRLLCSKIGISCEIVSGTSKGDAHAWNQVKVEGKWYNIDVTWDDPAIINGATTTFGDHSGNSYEYFCIPDSIMYKDHQTSNAPHKCTSSALFERALKAGSPWDDTRYISSSNELVELIKTEAQKGNYTTSFYIKQTLFTGDLGDAFMDCVSQAGVKFSGLSWSYFTYFEGTTDPGTFYRIELTIRQ